MKDEILEAVALAIAEVRRERDAALAALRYEYGVEVVALRTENEGLARQVQELSAQIVIEKQMSAEERASLVLALEEQVAKVNAVAATKDDLAAVRKQIADVEDAVPGLLIDVRAAVEKQVSELQGAVTHCATEESVREVWDALTGYAEKESTEASLQTVKEMVYPIADAMAGVTKTLDAVRAVQQNHDERIAPLAAIEYVQSVCDQLSKDANKQFEAAIAAAVSIGEELRAEISEKVSKEDTDVLETKISDIAESLSTRIDRGVDALRDALAKKADEANVIALSETVATQEHLQGVHKILADALARRATLEQVDEVRHILIDNYALKSDLDVFATNEDISAAIGIVQRSVEGIGEDLAAKANMDEMAAMIRALPTEARVAELQRAVEGEVAGLKSALDAATQHAEHFTLGAVDGKADELRSEFQDQLFTRAPNESLEAVRDEMIALIEKRATPSQIDAALEGTVARVRDEIVRRYQGAETWLRGGAGYQAYALVRHDGALWQSLRATDAPPGASDDWMLLSDGLRCISLEPGSHGCAKLVCEMTSGRKEAMDIRMPVPAFKGVYGPGTEYTVWDTVAKDGHVFLCLANKPTGAPGEIAGEWQVFSGPRGKSGKSPRVDERAIVNTVLREVIPQVQKALDSK